MPPPLSLRSILAEPVLDPAALLGLLVVGGLYVTGVRRLGRRGRTWPLSRTAPFVAGLAVVAVATLSGLAAYDTVLFSAHAVQHVLLGVVAPLLLALGAPVTLALQATDRSTQRAVLRLVHSRPVALLTHPLVGWTLFGGSLFALYFTPLFELSLRNDAVHAAVHAHFLLAGSVFFWPLIGVDPVRHRLPYGARILAVFLTVPVHAVLGVAILSSSTLLADGYYAEARPSWTSAPLDDQRTGGGILWAVGDLLGLAATTVVLVQWMQADEREAARNDRRLDAAGR